MENIVIAPSERTPGIDFDFAAGRFSIKGEAYPEDAYRFFGPLLSALQKYLQTGLQDTVVLDIYMDYFNSSSAKAFMNIFNLLDEATGTGVRALVRWHYDEGDEAMLEYGEDFSADLRFLRFKMVRVDA